MDRVGNKIQNVLEFLKQIKQLQRLFEFVEHLFMLFGSTMSLSPDISWKLMH